MKKHNSQGQPRFVPRNPFVCSHCKEGDCENCTDIVRIIVLKKDPICGCERPNHSGEPVNNQIADPETGTVYGPGLSVTKEGEVRRG